MTPTQHRRVPRHCSFGARFKGGSYACTRNSADDSQYSNPALPTPATREASMRKKLRGTSKGQAIRQKLVERAVKLEILQAKHTTLGKAELYEK